MQGDNKRALRDWAYAVGLALILAFGLSAGPASTTDGGQILAQAEGEVEIGRGDPLHWRGAREGDSLDPGDAVRTGAGGRAELQLGSATVRLYENSLLRIPPAGYDSEGPDTVEMHSGSALFDVLHRGVAKAFDVKTPEVVVSVKGTRFGLALESEHAAVSVYRGVVGVRAPQAPLGQEVLVRQGFAAVGSSEHPFELSIIPELDPWDGWAAKQIIPNTPEKLRRSAPDAAALDGARAAGQRAARGQMIETLAAERPDSAATARTVKRAHAPGQTLQPPAKHAPDPVEVHPIGDAPSPRTKKAMDHLVIDAVLDDRASRAGTPKGNTMPPITIQQIEDHAVVIDTGNGTSTRLDENDLAEMAEGGHPAAVGPDLNDAIEEMQVAPETFAEELQERLDAAQENPPDANSIGGGNAP